MPDRMTKTGGRHAAARSQLYQRFAVALSYPDESFIERLLNGEFCKDLIHLGAQLPYSDPFEGLHIEKLQEGINKQEIQIFYSTFFLSGDQSVPLRELAYSNLTEKALNEELFRFYQLFGLEFSHGELRELPDNLPIELEFLHYLTFLEAEASEVEKANANIKALRAAQSDFLYLHPGRWVLSFSDRLKSVQGCDFYSILVDLLYQFIVREKHFLSGLKDKLIASG
jgi:DMSO reductase family type II enzyme chaperone